jgi:hypothetical protein
MHIKFGPRMRRVLSLPLNLMLVGVSARADIIFNNFTDNVLSAGTSVSLILGAPVFVQGIATSFTVPDAAPGDYAWHIDEIDMPAAPNEPCIDIFFFPLPGSCNTEVFAIGTGGSETNGFIPWPPDSTSGITHFERTAGAIVLPGTRIFIAYSGPYFFLNDTGTTGPVALFDIPPIGSIGDPAIVGLSYTEQLQPAFRVIATPIPEPAAVLLLATVIVGLGLRIKRKFSAQLG